MKILFIDDNQDITKMFERYFKLMGHDICISNGGQNGLQMIQNEIFDVILLDLAMPDFSGYDVVEHLHKNNQLDNKTIVSLTASSISDNDQAILVAKGIHSVLRKPIDPDELLNYLLRIKS